MEDLNDCVFCLTPLPELDDESDWAVMQHAVPYGIGEAHFGCAADYEYDLEQDRALEAADE